MLLSSILFPMEEGENQKIVEDKALPIDCSTLVADILSPNDKQLLMLDCRSFLAFSDGHINGAVNVHCPSILRRRSRGQILPLRTLIPEDEVRERLCGNVPRECYRKVVLYDEKSFDMDSATDDSMLKLVNKCIQFEGRIFTIFYLKGGFKKFRQCYPHLSSIKPASAPVFGSTYSEIMEDETKQLMNPPYLSSILKSNNNLTNIQLQGSNSNLCFTKKRNNNGLVQVVPHVYLGSAMDASRREILNKEQINALLNLSPQTCPNYFQSSLLYKSINVDDTVGADITSHFSDAFSFIDSVVENGGNVLVHCHAGVSRSATICIAYIIYKFHLHLDHAFELVRSRRSQISPNIGFMHQLLQFESQFLSTSTNVELVKSPTKSSTIAVRPTSLPSILSSPLAPQQQTSSSSCYQPNQVFTYDIGSTTSCPVLPSSPSIFNSFCSTPRTILSPS